jgi:uncharacterized protein
VALLVPERGVIAVGGLTTVLIGGSVRAAAFSGLRAGLAPWCVDLFADADLRAVAPVRVCPINDYPDALVEMLGSAPAGPVIYTGGLENYPALIDRIAAERSLWGNSSEVLAKCRDPIFVSRLFSEAGIKHPWVGVTSREAYPTGLLRKPLAGAGGASISWAGSTRPADGYYFQQFIQGPSCSAAYCAFGDRVELLGVTEQFVGEQWLNGKPFHYCGSIGPIDVPATCVEAIFRVGETLRRGCGLRGLFGVDFILHKGEPWPIEVNPRYTASIEVLECATGLRAMERHRMAFDPHASASSPVESRPRQLIGKAILFAPRETVVRDALRWPITTDPFALPTIVDVPAVGERIEAGWPILTMFASGKTADECRERLQSFAHEVRSALLDH